MAVFNKFYSKCQKFLSSFVEEEYPAPRYERMANLIVQQLLANPAVPYSHLSHPFERYASEDLTVAECVDQLREDLEASFVQEDLEDLRLTFFAEEGLNRPDVEWIVEWFWKYADGTTGLGEFDEEEWDQEDEEDDEDEDQEDQENDPNYINNQIPYGQPVGENMANG
jgi:hypothetical protein